MKYLKLIIMAAFLSTMFTGCSYVSDMVEGAITDRASFGVTATYNSGNVILTWDKTDTDGNFAGIEIYRTSQPNDEYASYELVASRYSTSSLNSGSLSSGLTTTCNVDAPSTTGVYFYRVGFIHWDDDLADRTTANGYTGIDLTDYPNKTDIDAISGYGKVTIP